MFKLYLYSFQRLQVLCFFAALTVLHFTVNLSLVSLHILHSTIHLMPILETTMTSHAVPVKRLSISRFLFISVARSLSSTKQCYFRVNLIVVLLSNFSFHYLATVLLKCNSFSHFSNVPFTQSHFFYFFLPFLLQKEMLILPASAQ